MYVVYFCSIVSFFFFKHKTAYEMRISDWSSDVCSSDLEFRGRGATVLLADAQGGDLPVLAAHPAIEPVLMIQSFYRMASALALARGQDPDPPPHLNKVTETLCYFVSTTAGSRFQADPSRRRILPSPTAPPPRSPHHRRRTPPPK